MKGLDHHLLCLMQCHVNGVLMDEVPKFLAPIPIETMHAIQSKIPFDATCLFIIPLKLNGETSYFEVRTPTQEEYEDQNILKIELMMEAPPWDLSSPDFSHQELSMLDYRRQFVSLNSQARRQLFLNSVTSYAYDDADVMDDDNYSTVLESFVSTHYC